MPAAPSRLHPLSQPWVISPDGLELVLAIWSREELFADRLARARAEQEQEEREKNKAYHDDGVYCVANGIAQIPVIGPLIRHASIFDEISGATSYSTIARDLQTALDDQDVQAIVLRIDSPGGEATGCGELAERIRAADAQKPVVAYVEGAGASGAYWLASAARKVVCAPSAVLGSIGVRMALLDRSGAQEKMGLREVEIVSSQSPGKRSRPLDDEVLERVQTRCDDLAEVFVAAVAKFRGVSVKTVLEDFGGGDVLTGAKAVTAGLADELGSFESVCKMMAPPAPGATTMNDTTAGAGQVQDPELQQKWTAAQPVLATVAALTRETDPAKQVQGLAALSARAEQANALERELLVLRLQQKRVPPVAIKALEAAAEASGNLQPMRDALGNTSLQAPRPHVPAGEERAADPAGTDSPIAGAGQVQVDGWMRSYLAAAGITDPAKQQAEIERALAAIAQDKKRSAKEKE